MLMNSNTVNANKLESVSDHGHYIMWSSVWCACAYMYLVFSNDVYDRRTRVTEKYINSTVFSTPQIKLWHETNIRSLIELIIYLTFHCLILYKKQLRAPGWVLSLIRVLHYS